MSNYPFTPISSCGVERVAGEGEVWENAPMNYWIKWFLPGLGLILLAFWAGTMESMIFAFAGFLSFFVLGITLIIEGKKRTTGNAQCATKDKKKR